MSGTSEIKQVENSDVGTLSGETDDACRLLRQKLEALRNHRTTLRDSRYEEIEMLECQYRNAKENLQRKLPEYSNIKLYRHFLRYYQRENQDINGDGAATPSGICNNRAIPASNYIVQQETPLLSAMHRSFCVLPHQMELLKGEYERDIYPYLRKEIRDLNLDLLGVSDAWMSRLSNQAEENDALYDSYRTEVESIEIEVKRFRSLLLQQREAHNPCKGSEKDFDETSETERSSDSEDDLSSRGENSGGFFKDALNLFTASPSQDATKTSPIITLSDNFFQIAANNFLLPYASKND